MRRDSGRSAWGSAGRVAAFVPVRHRPGEERTAYHSNTLAAATLGLPGGVFSGSGGDVTEKGFIGFAATGRLCTAAFPRRETDETFFSHNKN